MIATSIILMDIYRSHKSCLLAHCSILRHRVMGGHHMRSNWRVYGDYYICLETGWDSTASKPVQELPVIHSASGLLADTFLVLLS